MNYFQFNSKSNNSKQKDKNVKHVREIRSEYVANKSLSDTQKLVASKLAGDLTLA